MAGTSTLRFLVVSGLLALGVGCGGPRAVRGSEVAGLDDQAMSTGLDKRDLDKMLEENLNALRTSAVVRRWQEGERPGVAVIPLRNETTEHVDSSLDALISDIETRLVNAGVRIISLDQQPKLVEEIKRQNASAFDPTKAAQWGKQVGARYILTGRVYSTDERQAGERRVQYFMFIQALDVETSEVVFQNKTAITKAII